MSTRRAVLPALLRRRSGVDAEPAPAYWGRIGEYEAVTRGGILILLSPDPRHPSLRAATAPPTG